MKIYNSEQIKAWDKFTLESEKISSIELMERAVIKCLPFLLNQINFKNKILIFCGNGNNGGDGLVAGRFLLELGYEVCCYVSVEEDKLSNENLFNRKLLTNLYPESIITLNENDYQQKIVVDKNTVIIDAIFGNGINRIIEGFYSALILHLNSITCYKKISMDIPSGLFGDSTVIIENQIVFKADFTFSFQQTKTSFLFEETGIFAGKVIIVNIELSNDFEKNKKNNFYYFDKNDAIEIFEKKASFASKHNYGHLLLVGGDTGKAGAIMMAANAANYSGCGRITVSTSKETASYLQINSPQSMVLFDKDFPNEIVLPKLDNFSAIAIGPGLGKEEEKVKLLRKIINDFKGPILFDADAISILADNKTWLAFLTPNSILTPHHYELQKLTGVVGDRTIMLRAAVELAIKNKLIIVYKGKNTAICLPNGDVVFNSSGNQALSKGGSGDLLTGYIGGLLAKGYSAASAAILGCFVQGKAAEYANEKKSIDGMNYSSILYAMDKVIFELENSGPTDKI
jgi:ADP-dependent NAD(P)H-hydrate dehydratase / NAD(P)H-hydrate epimerase